MAESSLSLGYESLSAAVGDFLGWGRGLYFGETVWTAGQAMRIDDCVRSGTRQFYHPLPAYDWSFLHLFTDPPIELAPGAQFVRLPDDAAGIEGDIVVGGAGQSSWYPRVKVGNPLRVKALYAECPTNTGWPRAAAIEQLKGTTLYAGQRQRLIVYPAADQDYTLTFQYYVEPDAPAPAPPAGTPIGTPSPNFPGITTGNPFVYGGVAHAETILESCLAVAELRRDDLKGLHNQQFTDRMVASIAADRRSKPQHIGRNTDHSDDREFRESGWWPQINTHVLMDGLPAN